MGPSGKLQEKVRKAGDAESLTGRENRWLKNFRAALRTGEGSRKGWIGVEGPRLVEEALRSGLAVEAVLVSTSGERHLERLRPWLEPPARVLRTTDRLFASVADTQTPQGVAALLRPRAATFDDLVRGTPLVVVLVGVQDPGNVGTILRAAEAFGATGAAACSSGTCGTANPFAPKVLRASAGSALRLPILCGVGLPVLMAQFRVAGVKLCAASPGALEESKQQAPGTPPLLNPWEADLRGPVALLVGNEGVGLPPGVERSTDAILRIPLAASVDSLNAAVAASVLLYETARQRGLQSATLQGEAPE